MDEEGCWNYRVVKRQIEDESEACYQVHEVYYDHEGKIELWISDPVEPSGESLEELRDDCLHFIEALQKPVLVESQRNGCDALIESEEKPPRHSGQNQKLKRKLKLPKITIAQLPEKLTIQGYDLLLTCDIAPEQYDVFKQKKLVGYLRLRHDLLRARYPDVDGEVVYESIVDEGDRDKVSECLTEAIMAIDKKAVADA